MPTKPKVAAIVDWVGAGVRVDVDEKGRVIIERRTDSGNSTVIVRLDGPNALELALELQRKGTQL